MEDIYSMEYLTMEKQEQGESKNFLRPVEAWQLYF